MAMHSATILAEENTKLQASNQRQKRKRAQRKQYIATSSALQAQEGQALIAAAKSIVQQSNQAKATSVRQRAPPTCSNCHIQGHNRRQCKSV